MRKLLFLLLTAMLCMNGFAQSVIDPFLGEEMTRRSDDEKINIIVIMKAQYDRAQLNRRADWFNGHLAAYPLDGQCHGPLGK